MLINRRFTYPPLKRVTRADGIRHYVCPETDHALPSVTTILSETADKSGLENWRAWVGDEKAELIKSQATGLGTLMHEHIEHHVMGIERPKGTNYVRVLAKEMADLIIDKGLCDVDEVWGQEVILHYPGLYAGTTDLVGVFDGKTAIMDHKSAKKLRTRAMITDYFHQMAAYALAHDYVYGTEIQIGVIFMADREKKFKKFIVTEGEMAVAKEQFLERLQIYYERNGMPEPYAGEVGMEEALVTA